MYAFGTGYGGCGIIELMKDYKRTIRTIYGHDTGNKAECTTIAFSFDFKLLASGSYDNLIKIWNVSNGKLERTIFGHNDAIVAIAFNIDNKLLASGSKDGTIKLWNVLDGSLVRTLEGYNSDVQAISFISNGKQLISGAENNPIKIWNVLDGTLEQTIVGHTNNISALVFSDDGNLMAIGTENKTIELWNISNWTLIQTFKNRNCYYGISFFDAIAFSIDYKYILSGSNGFIDVWNINDGSLIETNCLGEYEIWSFAVPSCLGVMNSILRRKKTLVNGFFWGGISSLLCKYHYGFDSFNKCLDFL